MFSGNRPVAKRFVRCYRAISSRDNQRDAIGRGLHYGLQTRPIPSSSLKIHRCIRHKTFSFPASTTLLSAPLTSMDDRFEDDSSIRNYSTTGQSPGSDNETSKEGTTNTPFASSLELSTSSRNTVSSPATRRQMRRVSTTIEPPVKSSRPFRRFRNADASLPSTFSLRQRAPLRRVFATDDSHLSDNEQQQQQHHHHQTSDVFRTPSPFARTAEYGSYPVIAIQVARSIDLSQVSSNVFATKGVRKMKERLSVVAQLRPNDEDASGNTVGNDEAARFVAVFRFGSVVFFNVSPKDIASLVDEIKLYSTGSSLSPERKDRFCVHVQPSHSTPLMQDDCDDDYEDDEDVVTADYCIVPELNMKAVDVISNIMAQSVALDSYNDTVDKLLADFERINNKVTNEGNLSLKDRDKMFRSVAENNAIFLKLTKVGIKDREDTAWNLSQYENISEGMREEFDIDRRFEHIEFKLNLIQQNAKFFLEVLANQKSDSLEWIIIVLILLECILMCVEMSGMGEPLFSFLGQFVPRPPSFS